jgi:hypothetical protein
MGLFVYIFSSQKDDQERLRAIVLLNLIISCIVIVVGWWRSFALFWRRLGHSPNVDFHSTKGISRKTLGIQLPLT